MKSMLALALTTVALVAGCAAPAALAPQGVTAKGSPLFDAMQEPGTGYVKHAE